MPNAGAMVMSSVKERPIIFTHNIEKLLDGRKTQTRRVVTPQLDSEPRPPHSPWHSGGDGIWRFCRGAASVSWSDDDRRCPFGVTGDRLWVRETFGPCAGGIVYRADGGTACPDSGKWRSPIFMPRLASRVILDVVDVRVERIQDISEEDAKAEGVDTAPLPDSAWHCSVHDSLDCGCVVPTAYFRDGFHALWDSIHGAGAWAANAWVWALTLKRVQ